MSISLGQRKIVPYSMLAAASCNGASVASLGTLFDKDASMLENGF